MKVARNLTDVCSPHDIRTPCNLGDPKNQYCPAHKYCYVFSDPAHHGLNDCRDCDDQCSPHNLMYPGEGEICNNSCGLYLDRQCYSQVNDQFVLVPRDIYEDSLVTKDTPSAVDNIDWRLVSLVTIPLLLLIIAGLIVTIIVILRREKRQPTTQNTQSGYQLADQTPAEGDRRGVQTRGLNDPAATPSNTGYPHDSLSDGSRSNGFISYNQVAAVHPDNPPAYEPRSPNIPPQGSNGHQHLHMGAPTQVRNTAPTQSLPTGPSATAQHYISIKPHTAPGYTPPQASNYEETSPKEANLPVGASIPNNPSVPAPDLSIRGPEYNAQPQSAVAPSSDFDFRSAGEPAGFGNIRPEEPDVRFSQVPSNPPVMAEGGEGGEVDYMARLLGQGQNQPEGGQS